MWGEFGRVLELELADGGEDYEADGLEGCGDVEGLAAGKALGHPYSEECRADVDASEDHGCDIRVLDAYTLENRSSVVEEAR